ncbi:hypothetical protein CAEBREN_01443 [Caenorhabditis brenneri]|uniref:Core Histone H2A/H2B/H3 domain-containing protein n=1 Tax=Caenorhabditis brenneri TaxID=135651 RepID=G0NI71_CAEBE|nr:hypothetical protein CAEBREN_01443 [Caenorhabditis brenneri]
MVRRKRSPVRNASSPRVSIVYGPPNRRRRLPNPPDDSVVSPATDLIDIRLGAHDFTASPMINTPRFPSPDSTSLEENDLDSGEEEDSANEKEEDQETDDDVAMDDSSRAHMTRTATGTIGALIDKEPFESLVKEIVAQNQSNFKIKKDAMGMILEASEVMLTDLFRAANSVAAVDGRERLEATDIQAVLRIDEILRGTSN